MKRKKQLLNQSVKMYLEFNEDQQALAKKVLNSRSVCVIIPRKKDKTDG